MISKRINIKNFESYIIDFLDGNLSDDLMDELSNFLDENPEIKNEFSDLLNYNASSDKNIKFNFKQALKQNDDNSLADINEDNCHEFMIAYCENDLNDAQKQSLFYFLTKNPKFENDFILFKHTKLQANKEIIFAEKNKLKKYSLLSFTHSKSYIYKTVGVAATFIIIFSLFYNYLIPVKNKELAQTFAIYSKSKEISKSNKTKETILNFKEEKNENIKLVKSTYKLNNSIETLVNKSSLNSLSSVKHDKILQDKNLTTIDETKRSYYSVLNELMIFTDETPTSLIMAKQEPYENLNSSNLLNQNILSDQPILEAGNYLINLAIIGMSRLDEFSNNIKEGYNTIEKRLEGK